MSTLLCHQRKVVIGKRKGRGFLWVVGEYNRGGAQGARPGAMEAPKVIWLGPENFLSRTKVGAILEGADVIKWKCCFKNIEFPLSTFRSVIHTII